MLSNRRFRLIAVLFALVSLLFMQLAVAGYVCPVTGSKVAGTAKVADSSMPCAESMPVDLDDAQPNLCKAHCQADQQTADRYELLPLVALDAVPADFALAHKAASLSGAPLQTPHLMRTTAPPMAIINCCFRL